MNKFANLPERIVLGTRNAKKLGELKQLLEPRGIQTESLEAFSNAIEVEETGSSFRENAILKAVEQATHLNEWVMGEDSGLSVDALDGAPGIYSARFSGENATDQKNNELLLERLKNVPIEKRTAHYTCYMVLSNPKGEVKLESQGFCRGRILLEAHGQGGFGYDPLFEVIEYHTTFGLLSPTVKSVLSHRARAMRKFLRGLSKVFE